MAKNIYDVQEVKELLDNTIGPGFVKELDLGLTAELGLCNKEEKQEIREGLYKLRHNSLGAKSYVNRETITSGTVSSSLKLVGDLGITIEGSENYEEDLRLLKKSVEDLKDLNLYITDLHLDYTVLPEDSHNIEDISALLKTPIEKGVVNKADVSINYWKNMNEITKGIRNAYRVIHEKHGDRKEENFSDEHFAIFDDVHNRGPEGELKLSLQGKSGEELQYYASALISSYLEMLDPEIEDSKIRFLVTPERYGK